MKTFRTVFFSILALLIIAGPAVAKHKNTRPSTAKLLKELCKNHDQAQDAANLLKSRKGVLSKAKRFLAHVRCTPDKDVILSLYDSLGQAGCQAIGDLLGPKQKTWITPVIRRYRALHTCPKLKESLYKALDFASPEQARYILDFAGQDKDPLVGSHAFKWLDKGSRDVKLAAIAAIVNGNVKAGYPQLMKTYNKLVLAKSTDSELRTKLLTGLLKVNAGNTIPLLINALSSAVDNASACDLLAKVPEISTRQMTMAIKMTHCRQGRQCAAAPITGCLLKIGTPAIGDVLALFDLHRPFIREFVVSFLRKWKSRDALEFLAGRYPKSTATDRADIVRILGVYSLGNKRVREIIDSAFKDGDQNVRLGALDMVTANRGMNFCPQVQDLAENDIQDNVKAAAVNTIYRLGCRKAIPLLKRMVTYERPAVSIRGLHALGLMLETGDLGFLYNLLKSGNQKVAKAARKALILLTNQDPDKKRISSLPEEKTWKFKGHKLNLPGATAWVDGDEKDLVIVIGGGLDGTSAWALPGMKDLVDEYTAAFVIPDSTLCPTEAVIALLEKVKHKKAYVMGNGIWALDAARLQLALPYQLQGAILVNPPYPTAKAIEDVSKAAVSRLNRLNRQAINELMKESPLIREQALNRYYVKLVSPALAPAKKHPWSVWGIPGNTLRYNRAEILLQKAMDRNSLSQAKALVVFSGNFIPEKQQNAYQKLKTLRVKKLKDCGYFVSQFCMDDLVDEIQDFTDD